MRLSPSDVEMLSAAQSVLLSPLDYGSREDWIISSLRAVKNVLRCDTSNFAYAMGTEVAGITEDFDPSLFQVFSRFDNDELDHVRAHEGLLASGSSVFVSSDCLRQYAGRPMEATRVYQEFMVPAGVRDGPGLIVRLPQGYAVLSVARSNQKRKGDYRRECHLLKLLQPSLAAGLRFLRLIEERALHLETLLDRESSGFAVLTQAGRELYRSARLVQMIAAESDPSQLLEGIATVAAMKSAGWERSVRPRLCLATSRATYDMSATYCSSGEFSIEPVVVVCVERLHDVLPTEEQLCTALGLSKRESEVTLLLAKGASNKEIAQRLRIRPATVRTHTEHVFAKLGVHSRKAIALSLLHCV